MLRQAICSLNLVCWPEALGICHQYQTIMCYQIVVCLHRNDPCLIVQNPNTALANECFFLILLNLNFTKYVKIQESLVHYFNQ